MADHRVALCILTLPLFKRARDVWIAALTSSISQYFFQRCAPFAMLRHDGALSTLYAYASMSRQDFPMDAIRCIGKKPPDMIGLPISKPSRVVLDFFWSCRLSVIADREGGGEKEGKAWILIISRTG